MRRILAMMAPAAIVLGASPAAPGQATAPRPGAATVPAQVPSPSPTTPKVDPAVNPTQAQAGAPAQAQTPNRLPPIADQQLARKRMEEVLARWEQQSAGIRTLDATFTRIDNNVAWNDKVNFMGRAILKSPNLAFLDFRRFDEEKKEFSLYEQIRCTGTEVYHYRNPTRQIFVYPLAPDQSQRALEEGPLPFLFNFKAAEALRRYEMTMLSETMTHYYIRIRPREQIDREAFVQADIQLDKVKFLPDALLLVAPNGKDTQTYHFNTPGAYIKPNVAVNATNFQGQVPPNWQVVRNPGPDGRPQPAAANVPAPAGRPAAVRPAQGMPRR